MGSEYQAAAFLNGEAERGERFANAGVVGDHAVFDRNVEVHANEDALSAKIEIVDGELVHKMSSQFSVVSFQSEKKRRRGFFLLLPPLLLLLLLLFLRWTGH